MGGEENKPRGATTYHYGRTPQTKTTISYHPPHISGDEREEEGLTRADRPRFLPGPPQSSQLAPTCHPTPKISTQHSQACHSHAE